MSATIFGSHCFHPEEITDGGQTTVKFTFDEHAQKIRPGPIKVSGPILETVLNQDLKRLFRRDGTYVGTMRTDGSAAVTFNEAIKKIFKTFAVEVSLRLRVITIQQLRHGLSLVVELEKLELNVKKMATELLTALHSISKRVICT